MRPKSCEALFNQYKADTRPRGQCGRAKVALLPSLADSLHLGADRVVRIDWLLESFNYILASPEVSKLYKRARLWFVF